MITHRDQEFTGTILAAYLSIGRTADRVTPEELEGWLKWCRAGDEPGIDPPRTGEVLFRLFAESEEGQAWAARPVAPELQRVHATGHGFEDESGEPYTWAMTTGFRDLDRLLRGQTDDLRAVLGQARDLGSTGRRVFACKPWWDVFDGTWHPGPDRTWPIDYPRYFERVADLADLCAEYGQHINLVAFTGTDDQRRQMLPGGDMYAFWSRLVGLAREKANIILSLGNELNAHDQVIDIASFQQPDGVLCSSGSNGAGSNPPEPYWRGKWGYCELHPERNRARPSLGTTTLYFARHGYEGEGDNPGYAGTQWDTVATEPLGFNETDEPGRRTDDPDVAFLLGLGCGWGAGGTALSTDGIESVLLRPRQAECTRRFLAGVKAGMCID